MVTLDILNEKRFLQSAEGYADNHLKAEILAFLSRHPHDKFTVNVISCALDHPKLRITMALKLLAEAGFVEILTMGNVTLYNLTTD